MVVPAEVEGGGTMRVLFNITAGVSAVVLFLALLGIGIGSFFPISMGGGSRDIYLDSRVFAYGWNYPPPPTILSTAWYQGRIDLRTKLLVGEFYRKTNHYRDNASRETIRVIVGHEFRFDLRLVAFYSAILPVIWAYHFRRERRERRKRYLVGKCAVCEYDLRVHSSGQRCPECGTVIP